MRPFPNCVQPPPATYLPNVFRSLIARAEFSILFDIFHRDKSQNLRQDARPAAASSAFPGK